jgi:hypothetical protein
VFEDSYEYTLRIERAESSSFPARSNVLFSKGLSKGLNKELPEMALSNMYETLSLNHEWRISLLPHSNLMVSQASFFEKSGHACSCT